MSSVQYIGDLIRKSFVLSFKIQLNFNFFQGLKNEMKQKKLKKLRNETNQGSGNETKRKNNRVRKRNETKRKKNQGPRNETKKTVKRSEIKKK
jgi:hypothetical protein